MLLRKVFLVGLSTLKTALENFGEKELAREIGEYDMRENMKGRESRERDRRKEYPTINSFHRLSSGPIQSQQTILTVKVYVIHGLSQFANWTMSVVCTCTSFM